MGKSDYTPFEFSSGIDEINVLKGELFEIILKTEANKEIDWMLEPVKNNYGLVPLNLTEDRRTKLKISGEIDEEIENLNQQHHFRFKAKGIKAKEELNFIYKNYENNHDNRHLTVIVNIL